MVFDSKTSYFVSEQKAALLQDDVVQKVSESSGVSKGVCVCVCVCACVCMCMCVYAQVSIGV